MRKITGQRICKIEGCTNILTKTSGTICQVHRSRMHRHGTYDISPNWRNLQKGKPSLTKLGYVRINVGGKRILQHRYIMEQHLGRPLTKGECVHHINGDRTDNRIENLDLIENNGEHMHQHHAENWKNRTIRPAYSQEAIHEIVTRAFSSTNTYEVCFCGKPIDSRNLCMVHYQWAYKHILK